MYRPSCKENQLQLLKGNFAIIVRKTKYCCTQKHENRLVAHAKYQHSPPRQSAVWGQYFNQLQENQPVVEVLLQVLHS